MAVRPVFLPRSDGFPFVTERQVEFEWFPGLARSQAQKSIASLHRAMARQGLAPVLEISSKSPEPLGVALSAFYLMINEGPTRRPLSVECAFQGSKVFERGGPYHDLYGVTSREAKNDPRLRASGDVVAFDFGGRSFPSEPRTAFYNWLYLQALQDNARESTALLAFSAFTDIAFNPQRSLNCQARAAALYVALHRTGVLQMALSDAEGYLALMRGHGLPPASAQQLNLFGT